MKGTKSNRKDKSSDKETAALLFYAWLNIEDHLSFNAIDILNAQPKTEIVNGCLHFKPNFKILSN